MSDIRNSAKRSGSKAGKPGDLSRDVARLAAEAGVETADVYAFLCGGCAGPGSSPDWLDKEVSDDVKKHLRSL